MSSSSPMLQQPPLGSPSGADAADPLHEESVSQAKTVYSDSDSGEDVSAEFPVGLLRCTPDKPAFSRTPSPNKDYHQACLLAQPTQLHSFTRPVHHREVSTAAATTARATRRSRTARGRGSPTRLWKDSRCPIAGRSRAGALSRWI